MQWHMQPSKPSLLFSKKVNTPLTKQTITTLQINLGKRCNLACNHCHVEAGPKRTEELSPEVCARDSRAYPTISTN